MRIGAVDLVEKYGSPLEVAEALLEGKLNSIEQQFVSEVVSKTVMEAAKFRMENKPRAKKVKARSKLEHPPIGAIVCPDCMGEGESDCGDNCDGHMIKCTPCKGRGWVVSMEKK